jgi:hypothetical protein
MVNPEARSNIQTKKQKTHTQHIKLKRLATGTSPKQKNRAKTRCLRRLQQYLYLTEGK